MPTTRDDPLRKEKIENHADRLNLFHWFLSYQKTARLWETTGLIVNQLSDFYYAKQMNER